jgi:uncharacterized membrane protein
VSVRTLAEAGIAALLALVLAWHLALAPPQQIPAWVAAMLHVLPLVPALVLLARRRPSAAFWGALAALILFCHGVSEAWSSAGTRAGSIPQGATSTTSGASSRTCSMVV